MQQQHATGQAGATRRNQVVVGLTLAHEQFPLPKLLEFGVLAEQAGFAAVWASDHFEPWQDNLGHCGLAWVTLAALGQRTQRLLLGTDVTCPSYRYRPQIVAQAFASLGLLYPGRVFLGVGAGEAVNQLPGGGGWGAYQERVARLEEAVMLIRRLWTGEWGTPQGRYYPGAHAPPHYVPHPPVPLHVPGTVPPS